MTPLSDQQIKLGFPISSALNELYSDRIASSEKG